MPGPTVARVVAEHVDLLTAVGTDTRAHSRQQMTAHIVPMLGVFPVAAPSNAPPRTPPPVPGRA